MVRYKANIICIYYLICIVVGFASFYRSGSHTGWPQKSDNKAGLVLARMFSIVGALFHHCWIRRKEILHASFGCKICYPIERLLRRCLINEIVFWRYVIKECATATLRESLASRLQISGGPSHGCRSSATPVLDMWHPGFHYMIRYFVMMIFIMNQLCVHTLI